MQHNFENVNTLIEGENKGKKWNINTRLPYIILHKEVR